MGEEEQQQQQYEQDFNYGSRSGGDDDDYSADWKSKPSSRPFKREDEDEGVKETANAAAAAAVVVVFDGGRDSQVEESKTNELTLEIDSPVSKRLLRPRGKRTEKTQDSSTLDLTEGRELRIAKR